FEAKPQEPRMTERALHGSHKRAEREAIAERKRRRQRALFGARTPVAGTEQHRRERDVLGRERGAAGKAHFERRAACEMRAVKTRRERGGVVCNDEVSGAQVIDPFSARRVRNGAGGADDEQPRVARTLNRLARRDHACSLASAASTASTSSRAAVCGRLSVARSASG